MINLGPGLFIGLLSDDYSQKGFDAAEVEVGGVERGLEPQ